MANYLYPDPRSMDFFGEYMTPEIYPWMGQSTTSRVDRSAFSPLLFPQERPTTSPIISEEILSRSIGEPPAIEPTDYRTEHEKKLEEIEKRIASSPISIQPYVSPETERANKLQEIENRIATSPIPIEPYVSPKMADTQTKSSFMDNLGGLLFGGGGTDGLEGYLSPQQQAAIQRQAMMQAAAALLKSSGTTTQPISLGQALGGAFEAGTAGYQGAQQNAIQQLLVKQKLDEMKRAQQAQQAYQNLLLGQPTAGEVITPDQAISAPGMPVGPTVERAALIGQQVPTEGTMPSGLNVLSPMQRAMLSTLPAEKGIPELLKLTKPTEKAQLLSELGLKPTLENLRLLDKPEAAPEKIRYLQALQLPITLENLHKLDKPEALPHEIQILQAVNKPVTMENVMALRRSSAQNINIGEGQKGFENTFKLKQAFSNEPIYKDFNDMKSAYSQVLTSLKQGTPISDVAATTKIMKLLDPGSVVRESELGIAMAASGRMDRLKNYITNFTQGTILTPTQRADFESLANELYAAAGQTYNAKRDEYLGYATSFGLDAEKALGSPVKLPSIEKLPKTEKTAPKVIQDILNKYPARTQ